MLHFLRLEILSSMCDIQDKKVASENLLQNERLGWSIEKIHVKRVPSRHILLQAIPSDNSFLYGQSNTTEPTYQCLHSAKVPMK